VPVPDSETASGELVALLVIVSAPPRAPSAVGENFTVTLHFLRGAIVGPHPLTLEKSPLATMPTNVTGDILLVFVITMRFDLLVAPAPNTTLPSRRLRGDTPSAATGVGVGVGVAVGVALAVAVGVAVGVADWAGVFTGLGVGEGVAEAVEVALAVAVAVGVADAVGVEVRVAV
jgi:hypothetical protein